MMHLILFLTLIFQNAARPHAILAVGDSMTAGYGVARENAYPAQLEDALRQRGYEYAVINQGVTGSTTTQAFSRLARALSVQADIVIIQLGGNDASQGIPRDVSQENLRRMIARFKAGGTAVFFAGGRFAYLDEIARELKVPVIPFLTGVQGHAELLIADGVHPNADGYAIVVHNILTAIEPFIASRRTGSR